jgi:hypothetical protein
LGREFNGNQLAPIEDGLFFDRKIYNVKNHAGNAGCSFFSFYPHENLSKFLERIFE